ncbi:uncharacterized protein MONOS_18257 [Monocercomonoides exilis]|uniref:uncharacterized protein n=1 Tax=Monocercomonoides exilis TaxID=2049356 RepID=UPI00355AC204|nr:hypothetical protein MONOS_18257 [Monocercomonoides exilis]
MISGFVEEIKVLSGTVVEGKGVDIGEKTIFVNGVSPAGSAIETQFESNGLSLFCVGTGELTVSDLSVVHNSSLENNRRSILFEVQGAGGINLERLNISMDADHSEERSIQNSLVKMEGGSLKMKGVRWGQTFSTTSAISLPQGSSVSLSLDNCTFSNIVRTTAGSSLMNVGEGSYSITLDGCTIDGCGSEDSEFGGGMMIEMGNVGSLTMNGGIVRNCYASTTQGRGGGVGLKVRDINVEFLVSSAFEGNRAKWGSDIFIDSIDLETTAKSGKIASLTDSLETKSKMQGFENGDESFPIPLCVFLWNNFSAPAFVGGGSLSHDFSMCGFKEFPCSTIEKAASVHFEGKKKDITIFESFAFEDEVSLRTDEWNIKANQNEMKCGVADLTDGTQSGLIENSVSVSMTSIVFSLIQSLSSHESVFECHSGKLTLNKCGMEGGTDSISTVFVSVVGGAVEVIDINSRPSLNITNSDFGEITFGNGCVVECHNGNIEKITGCTFSSITRSKGSGGCISIMNGHDGSDYKAEINDCTFEGCSVEGEEEEIGGGAFFYKASTNTNLLMSECEFYYCTALHEGEEVGYGGGIMLNLLSEMGEATFVISSPTFSSDKQNNAKYGKDLFVSSLSLISSIKNETLPFVKDRLEILTEDSMKGYDGGNRECAIPLIYFWKEVGSSVFVAEEGNNVVVCGLLEYPCGSVDYGMRRGGSLGIESIAIQGTCDVRTEMSVSGMRLEGTNGETDKIQFVKIIEGDKDAVVECKGVVQFKEVGILIPSAFDNEANILVQTGTDAIKTTIAGCSIHISDNAEGELTFVLISATKGIVEIEKTKMAGLASMHEIMSISVGCVITVSDVSFEEISLSRKSAIVMNENEIPENGNDNAEEEWNVLFEQCLFLNVKHSVLSNPSLLFCDSVAKKSLPFVLSNITFKENVALKGRDVFVKSIDLDSQISESQFLINFGEPFVKELAIWGCTADDYGDEEDLLGRVYVFRSEFIFVSSIVGNSSNSKNCGEMKSACSSLNVGVSHIIPSDYSQLLIWNETILAGSCSAQKVTIKSMEASRNAEIKVNEMNLAGEGAVTTSESVRIEKVSFVFGVMQNVILCSERATFEDLTACNVQCTSSVIECGKSEKVIISNRLSSGPCIICTAQHMTNFEMCNCSFHKCTSEPSKGSQVAIALTENILMDSCTFEGNLADNTEEINGVGNKICQWNGSVVDFSSSSVMMKDTTICNSSKGGMTVSGGNVMIEKGEFVNNNPSIDRYPSLRRNIICSDSGTLNVMSLKGGDGLKDNTSLWMSNDGCSFEGIISERASPFFIPVLESIEENEKGEEMEVVFKGKLLLPCNLSFMIVKQMGDEKQIEKYEFDESGYASETEVEGRLKREIIREAGDEAEVRVLILFGNAKNPSSTDPFILKNRSEPKANGDERIKVKNEAEDLREIVNDNIRKDPKAFEMVTMEMSPEEQWRRAEREAEKKNDERMKKRVYDTNMQHSESSEHLLSESGSTEYILGRDSDKIPQWMLEKEEEDDDISRKRTPSPSISSTSTSDTTDSDSTFVRGEDLCPTTSSMSNLVDAMACSSPHEKLIVDLRDSLFMLLHGRNEKKRDGDWKSSRERNDSCPDPSLGSLSPHIVLFSEHMVICIAMHSDCSSDSDTSSSISSSTVVTSASDDESDSLPSSAFEDDEDNRKEWMMLWECLTLQIPFGEYEAETAGEKIKNGERPGMESIRGSEMCEAVENGLDGDPERRASLMQVKRYLVGHLPSGYTMATVSDAIAYCEGSEECGSEYIERSGVIVKLHSGSESEIQTRESSG